MNDLQRILREGDPAGDPAEERLTPQQTAAMRRHVLTAPVRTDVLRTPWQQPLALAAMVAMTIAAGVMGGLRFAPAQPDPAGPPEFMPSEAPRQFQFSTPGGTRIIWVFDPEFQMKETVP